MFDRFSREDRTLFMFATQEARDLGHPSFGNDHLILGMLCNARSPIFTLLGERGLTLDAARGVVREFHQSDEPTAESDEKNRYDEDRDALASIGIDLDRVRAAVRDKFGDDLADGWGERRGRGRGARRGDGCDDRRGHHRPHGRGPGFGGPFGGPGGPGGPGWDGEGPWEGGRGRRGPRGRGRARMNGPVRDAMHSAVTLARARGDRSIGAEHLLLGILDAGDPASRAVIESATDVDSLRGAVTELLDSRAAV
ncbi:MULTISPECIES: Clp protease N-terminal domain-containing protein [Gordonia]|uniref:Clp protease N-terminal domain-containing protein n=1 Tax=Gordonia TaxID=2053 RepID=UPI0030FE3C5B